MFQRTVLIECIIFASIPDFGLFTSISLLQMKEPKVQSGTHLSALAKLQDNRHVLLMIF